MKNVLKILALIALSFTSCTRPLSLVNQQLYLIKPVMNGKRYSVVLCQFRINDVEIFAFHDSFSNNADYIKGKFRVEQNQLIFPEGTFDIKRTSLGYNLLAYNKIKYQLLTVDGYKKYKELNIGQSVDQNFL
ncbi:hypothetical protein [uncultured Pedobacter sp.]|uniref:hypothetical protein n=1 Tax=uncultured Pedobacter sp. TaxID=246139 RepID=UPI0025D93EB3|nr:hypothetical protein [uncultured Pedobacter sp.]